jgi:predicted nucleic acid-binding protein
VASAIARRAREGAFAVSRRDRMTAALDGDLPALAVVEMIPEITAEARALLGRHPLRTGDAIQLASCLYLQRELREAVSFVAFDRRLSDAARAEGLTVVGLPGARRERSSRGRGVSASATRRSPSPRSPHRP